MTSETLTLRDATIAAVLEPDTAAEAWAALGIAYHQGGDIRRARAAYAKALTLSPPQMQVANNLAALAAADGNWIEALRHFTLAVTGDPANASFLTNRAAALRKLNRGAEAARILFWLPALDPARSVQSRTAIVEICGSMVNAGAVLDALPLVLRLLKADIHDEAARSLFVSCARRISWGQFDPTIHSYLAHALTAPWCAPAMLTASAASLLKAHPLLREFLGETTAAPRGELLRHLAHDALFQALLNAGPNTDPQLEMALTALRRHLLARAGDGHAFSADETALLALIARQAFTNEYVFWQSDEETAAIAGLKTRIEDGIRDRSPLQVTDFLVLAGYLALGEIAGAEALAAAAWPEAVRPVIRQQILEPAQECEIAEHIETLTPIENEVSQAVRAQYEENPYPRWVTAAPVGAAVPVEHYLRAKFPHAPIQPSPGLENPEILVAGCGTGHHSLTTARLYRGARVLAVDLSRRSLAYAIRKSREAGADLTYAQADLLHLPALGRRFDSIESVGVLHHMADPFAGWEALVSMLRPGGFMVLGFYSEIARETLPGDLGSDIRRARQAIMAATNKLPLLMGDFYATSSCRDLLFHVQEHRMTLPGISGFLAAHGLTFLGFNLPADRLHAYRIRYPGDTACRDLAAWDAFEKENPTTFLDMYQFWVQKQI